GLLATLCVGRLGDRLRLVGRDLGGLATTRRAARGLRLCRLAGGGVAGTLDLSTTATTTTLAWRTLRLAVGTGRDAVGRGCRGLRARFGRRRASALRLRSGGCIGTGRAVAARAS